MRAVRARPHLAAAAVATASTAAFTRCRHGPPDPSQAVSDQEWYRRQDAHIRLGLPLVEEARQGWWHEVTRRIRDNGESVDARAADGTTVLHVAAKAGRRRLCEELLRRGAAAHARDHRGSTALLCCAENGSETVAATLEANDASFDINEQDSSGACALSIAARLGHVRLIRWLLSHTELRPMIVDLYGVAALHKAVSFGQTQCVEALLMDERVRAAIDQPVGLPTAPDAFAAKSGGETALILAAKHTYFFHHTQHTRIARSLLAAGADPNIADGHGRTAVHSAAAAGNVKILHELVSSGRVAPRTWLREDGGGKSVLDLARADQDARALVLEQVQKARSRCKEDG